MFTADSEVYMGDSKRPAPQACKPHCKLSFSGGPGVAYMEKAQLWEQENLKPNSEPATLTSCVTMNFELDLSEP